MEVLQLREQGQSNLFERSGIFWNQWERHVLILEHFELQILNKNCILELQRILQQILEDLGVAPLLVQRGWLLVREQGHLRSLVGALQHLAAAAALVEGQPRQRRLLRHEEVRHRRCHGAQILLLKALII